LHIFGLDFQLKFELKFKYLISVSANYLTVPYLGIIVIIY